MNIPELIQKIKVTQLELDGQFVQRKKDENDNLVSTGKVMVAGAAEFESAKENTFFPNTAYLLWLDELTIAENNEDASINIILRNEYAVIACLDNRSDKRGQTAVELVDKVRSELLKALLNYKPTGAIKPMEYDGARVIDQNPAFMWIQFDFFAETNIDETDGSDITHSDEFLRVYGVGDEPMIKPVDPVDANLDIKIDVRE